MPAATLGLPGTMTGAVGAGSPTKWAPPSVVRTIEVQTGLLHGASPSSQYWSTDIAVKETGSKPEGTEPPAGCEPATVLPLAGLVAGTDVETVVGPVVVGLVVGALVAGAVLGDAVVAVVGATVLVMAGAVVVALFEVLPADALLPPPPQPAAKTPADSNAAGQ
jgi:hypothetical protein